MKRKIPSLQANCGNCRYAVKRDTALVCHGPPPACVVIDGKPLTMRPAVQPDDPACDVWQRKQKPSK